jgi:hypothetical protein
MGGDPGCQEAVAAELGFDNGRAAAPADHCVIIRLWYYRARPLTGTAPDRTEQRPLGITAQGAPSR